MLLRLSIYMVVLLIGCKITIAQSFSGTVNSTATIGATYVFSRVDNGSNNINFTTVSQIANGVSITNLSIFSVKSNTPWALSAASATTYFTGSGTYASSNMPASVLTLDVTGQPPKALNTTNQTLTTGNRGIASVSGNTFSVNITATPGFDYGPGSYTITVNYTLSAL